MVCSQFIPLSRTHINLLNNCSLSQLITQTLTAQLRKMATSLSLRCRPVGGPSSGKSPMCDNPSGNPSIIYVSSKKK